VNEIRDPEFIIGALAVLCAAASAVVSSTTSDSKPGIKRVLNLIAIVSLALGVAAGVMQSREKKKASDESETQRKRAEALDAQVHSLRQTLDVVNLDTTDLSALKTIGGKQKQYFVRLSLGPSTAALMPYKRNIENQFGIGDDSTELMVVDGRKLDPTIGNAEPCALIWGHGLSLVAAEVVKRLADGHALANPRAIIRVQTTDPLKAIPCR
jgi:hypothetical protein